MEFTSPKNVTSSRYLHSEKAHPPINSTLFEIMSDFKPCYPLKAILFIDVISSGIVKSVISLSCR